MQQLIESGELPPEAEVQSAILTGGEWRKAAELATYKQLHGLALRQASGGPLRNSAANDGLVRLNTAAWVAAYVILILAGFLPMIMHWFLVRRMWRAIRESGHARTSPGRAFWFLLVPGYNFYWVFQAYWGFAKDFNAYAKDLNAHGGAAIPHLPERLYLTHCILYCVYPLTFIVLAPLAVVVSQWVDSGGPAALGVMLLTLDGIVLSAAWLSWVVIGLVVLLRTCTAVNELADFRGQTAGGRPPL